MSSLSPHYGVTAESLPVCWSKVILIKYNIYYISALFSHNRSAVDVVACTMLLPYDPPVHEFPNQRTASLTPASDWQLPTPSSRSPSCLP